MKKGLPVGRNTLERSLRRRWRTRGGGWSFVIARAVLPRDADPETFTHEDVAAIIQAIERTGLGVNVTAIRYDLEWLIWDRDGRQCADQERHEHAA